MIKKQSSSNVNDSMEHDEDDYSSGSDSSNYGTENPKSKDGGESKDNKSRN